MPEFHVLMTIWEEAWREDLLFLDSLNVRGAYQGQEAEASEELVLRYSQGLRFEFAHFLVYSLEAMFLCQE